jgi:hypothetical protein
MGTDWEGLVGSSESGLGFGFGEEERDRWGNGGNGGLGRQWLRAWERSSFRDAM